MERSLLEEQEETEESFYPRIASLDEELLSELRKIVLKDSYKRSMIYNKFYMVPDEEPARFYIRAMKQVV